MNVFFLILFSVSCSSVAQLLLKIGMTQAKSVLNQGNWLSSAMAIGLNPWVFSGLSLYFFGAMVWLLVLAKVDLSFAYPFVGLGFILTMILGKYVMGDEISVQRLLGTLLVIAGVLMIAIERKV